MGYAVSGAARGREGYRRLEEAEGRRPLGRVLAAQRLGQVVLVHMLCSRLLPLGTEHDDTAGDALAEHGLSEGPRRTEEGRRVDEECNAWGWWRWRWRWWWWRWR